MSKILLIEPNTLLAEIYVRALAHSGHEVRHVTTGQAAVDKADEQSPDLLIMELQLAGHDGVEFLHEFRSYEDWADVPVIVNTITPPAVLGTIEAILRRELQVSAVTYKPRTTLQDLVQLVRLHAHAA